MLNCARHSSRIEFHTARVSLGGFTPLILSFPPLAVVFYPSWASGSSFVLFRWPGATKLPLLRALAAVRLINWTSDGGL
ncbi:hypothetical protein PDE_03951 [Penicillium oxalicum 114-2]|uniref:Uncharacterized protein n=1 Tax=Penicillium oxalicum (strain 114-2 / CGMCC 5302) TaxID=933388 RepID=S7ZEC0_PENO1|nr:hypothetical protein PDE_03951 [Penicillium oxalicum 114-2]